jgi:hypothetical protein
MTFPEKLTEMGLDREIQQGELAILFYQTPIGFWNKGFIIRIRHHVEELCIHAQRTRGLVVKRLVETRYVMNQRPEEGSHVEFIRVVIVPTFSVIIGQGPVQHFQIIFTKIRRGHRPHQERIIGIGLRKQALLWNVIERIEV